MGNEMFESLEGRRLLSASAAVVNGVLVVKGDLLVANTIAVSHSGSSYNVSVTSQTPGSPTTLTKTISDTGVTKVRIVGGDKADTITLTNSPVHARINGRAGADTITAGAEDDDIDGGPGADSINAGNGNNVVRGGLGNDTILTGTGNDSVFAGAGNDSVDAGDGNDKVYGGPGADTLLGGNGNDTLWGGLGNDSVNGGAGDDKLGGVLGANTLIGGAGADTFVVRSLAGNTTDFVQGTDILKTVTGNNGGVNT